MTIRTYWQLDVAEDAARSETSARQSGLFRDVRTPALNRYDYYAQVAQAAAQTAFDGLFVPHRPQSDDSAIVAAAIARAVPRLALIPEFPASVGSAVYAAKQAVSFQRQTHERLGWAIAAAADGEARARDGDHVPEEQLPARVEEFLTVARGVHAERPFDFAGAHFQVQGGGFLDPLNRVAFPKVFLQGESEEALALSARAADIHLFAAAPLAKLRARVEALDALALREGRTVEFGLIQPVLARDDPADARRDAERAGLSDTAIVGSHAEVAEQLGDLARAGFRHFVLAAPSSLEEAYRIGQHVLPRFRALTGRVAAAA
ncbi:LLM class flavin-dependent oxidoreductase [Sphingomonas sp. HF-S4]|uniref:LLM class flavin-dependent oxidoreductase n=1 Tax=Sphingomonas agrestis TaxID=3080540 RepID=A0ABU3Y482_9SPHN|nr:LLM class flavin-dependent oxidoreductase [Sphingomonas sp. HF-S4]MDV3456201.1 LLM class flavin-dependent oxidoreductase [Sphingomonas sp. HF-S4]